MFHQSSIWVGGALGFQNVITMHASCARHGNCSILECLHQHRACTPLRTFGLITMAMDVFCTLKKHLTCFLIRLFKWLAWMSQFCKRVCSITFQEIWRSFMFQDMTKLISSGSKEVSRVVYQERKRLQSKQPKKGTRTEMTPVTKPWIIKINCSWFTSFSRGLSTSRVVYCASKPIEIVVYSLSNEIIFFFLVKPGRLQIALALRASLSLKKFLLFQLALEIIGLWITLSIFMPPFVL